jgi:hypothetical protein
LRYRRLADEAFSFAPRLGRFWGGRNMMTVRHKADNLNYEEYVDGLRKANTRMIYALQTLVARADDVIAAVDGGKAQFEPEMAALSAAASIAERLLARVAGAGASGKPVDIITVHVEGGLVQDVAGVPEGCELRVEDYDTHDTSHPSWDAQKECCVTIFDGGANG